MRCEGYMLITRDLREAKRFYTEVIGARIVLELEKHVVFEEGFSLLQEDDWRDFAELEGNVFSYRHHTGQLVFEVEDLEAFLHRLAGMPSLQLLHPVKEHHWGRRAVRFYDPDGHVVEVGESMELVVKRFLRQGMSLEKTAKKTEFPLWYVLKCKNEI